MIVTQEVFRNLLPAEVVLFQDDGVVIKPL